MKKNTIECDVLTLISGHPLPPPNIKAGGTSIIFEKFENGCNNAHEKNVSK